MNLSLFAKYLVTTTFLKLDFVEIEFKKGGKLLNILERVIDPYIFFSNSGIWPLWPT